jgi:hypothetical protein
MIPAFVSRLCGQSSAAATVRAGLQPGQFSAAGGTAPVSASLDVDDVAGKTDQDRGEGCVPFRENCLPDGGGGGPARVVPGRSGRNWAAEIGNGVIRMKEETQQLQGNAGNHGGGVVAWAEKVCEKPQIGAKRYFCHGKPEPDWKKD